MSIVDTGFPENNSIMCCDVPTAAIQHLSNVWLVAICVGGRSSRKMSRAVRRFIRSEGFEGRDVQAEIDAEKESIKKARAEMVNDAKKVRKENTKQFEKTIELANRKAFIDHWLKRDRK